MRPYPLKGRKRQKKAGRLLREAIPELASRLRECSHPTAREELDSRENTIQTQGWEGERMKAERILRAFKAAVRTPVLSLVLETLKM